jgi:hypothetical protein
VFIHGNIVLVERRDELLAVVIDMEDQHTYRAGNWLTELPVERGTRARLSGVATGSEGLSPLETILSGVRLLPDSPHIYATFSLPKHIVEYDSADLASARLEGFDWKAVPFAPDHPVATLHLIAEPESEVEPDHTMVEFNTASKIFEGADVVLHRKLSLPEPDNLEDGFPEVLPRQEIANLFERRALLSGLAAFYHLNDAALLGGAFGGPGGELCASFSGSEP